MYFKDSRLLDREREDAKTVYPAMRGNVAGDSPSSAAPLLDPQISHCVILCQELNPRNIYAMLCSYYYSKC